MTEPVRQPGGLRAVRGVRVIGFVLLAGVTAGVLPPSAPPLAVAAGARDVAGARAASSLLFATLFGVAATSAASAWAVGGRNGHSLILRWNGKTWRVVHSPDPAGAGALFSVATTSVGNAWAVSGAAGPGLGTSISVINHWNGRTWKRVTSPNPVPGGAIFFGVAASSARNAWAVGTDLVFVSSDHNVIAHWNGKAWKLMHSPILDGSLYGVTAISAASAWAVGSGDGGAIIEHWNGKRWSGTTFG